MILCIYIRISNDSVNDEFARFALVNSILTVKVIIDVEPNRHLAQLGYVG